MRTSRSVLVALLTLALGAMTASGVSAQESSPEATPGGPPGGFPVAVHEGTCENPTAQPAFDIGNATAPGTDQGGEVETVGQASGPVIVVSQGEIDSSLDDLGNTGTVIAIHASSDDYETLVACGAIAGIKADGKVAIPLAPVGDSTTVGVAILEEDDDQTQATVYIFDTLPPSEGVGTPAATPSS